MAVPTPKDLFPPKPTKEFYQDELRLDELTEGQDKPADTAKVERSKPSPKPKFVRTAGLTDRALKNHPGLMALKDQIASRGK